MIAVRTPEGKLFGPFTRSVGRLLRRLAWVAVVFAGVAAAGFGILWVAASHRLRTEEAAWAGSFGTLEAVAERYPPRQANGTALELEILAREVGVTLAPHAFWKDRPRAPREKEAELGKVSRELWKYKDDCLRDDGAVPCELPPGLSAFLSERREGLDAVVARLRAGEPPRWEVDLRAPGGAPLPNMLGHSRLQDLLLTRALERIARGDRQAASEALEAAWNLNRSLWERPETTALYFALWYSGRQAAALRKLDAAPPEWGARLAGLDVTSACGEGVIGDAFAWKGAPAPPPG